MELLTTIRNAGNYFFTQQEYYKARQKYRKANRYYNLLRKRYDWQELEHLQCTDDDLKKLDCFSAINHLNMAAVEIKLDNYSNARYSCREALRLDPSCGKGYYRLGQAQIAMKNYEEAITNLKKAHNLIPDNKQILNELHRAKQLLTNYNREQMVHLKKLFK